VFGSAEMGDFHTGAHKYGVHWYVSSSIFRRAGVTGRTGLIYSVIAPLILFLEIIYFGAL
jgi:hypothetical protein